MRLLALIATMFAFVVAGCGDEDEKTDTTDPTTSVSTTVSGSTALPLTVKRAGGVAGIREMLVVRADGSGTVTGSDGTTREVTPDDTAELRAVLRELDLSALEDTYGPKEDVQVADGIDYSFAAGGKTVVVQEMAEGVPEELEELKAAAGKAMYE